MNQREEEQYFSRLFSRKYFGKIVKFELNKEGEWPDVIFGLNKRIVLEITRLLEEYDTIHTKYKAQAEKEQNLGRFILRKIQI